MQDYDLNCKDVAIYLTPAANGELPDFPLHTCTGRMAALVVEIGIVLLLHDLAVAVEVADQYWISGGQLTCRLRR